MPNILGQKKAYRQGLVLGLTMAEIVILIIFILLLTISYQIKKQKDEVNAIINNLNVLTERNTLLEKELVKFEQIINRGKIDDLFHELELAKENHIKIEKMNQQLVELKEKEKELNDIKIILSESGLKSDDIKNHSKEIQELKSQIKNMQRRGIGTEKPACWATNDGKPEYIYDIAITSDSITIRDILLAHRSEDKVKLPTNLIQLNESLSVEAFLEQTEPLFIWSENNNCRFFVRLYDETLTHQKNIYKNMRNITGYRFYSYEVRDNRFYE